MQKLFIPILDNGDGRVCVDYMLSMFNGFGGQQVHIVRISDSHPGRARNRAAAAFLRTDCTHLLFIDADIVFTRHDVEAMTQCDEPILAGLYPKKVIERVEWCMNPLPGEENGSVRAGTVFEVKRAGTGFLRIARDVFERMKPSVPSYTNHGKEEWDFFQSGVAENEWLSEDWYFCDIARRLGFKVMMHSGIQLRHVGTFVYPKAPDRLTYCPPNMREHIERIWCGEYDMPFTPKTVLDIGANIGGFSVWAAERWPGVSVESYEPHPDNVVLFHLNTRGIEGVSLNACGVNETGGVLNLIEGGNCGEHSFRFENGKALPVLTVKASDLKSAEFVKIDTEGCEVEILRNLDLSATKAVALEYHSFADRVAISDLLIQRGFTEFAHEAINDQRGILKFMR